MEIFKVRVSSLFFIIVIIIIVFVFFTIRGSGTGGPFLEWDSDDLLHRSGRHFLDWTRWVVVDCNVWLLLSICHLVGSGYILRPLILSAYGLEIFQDGSALTLFERSCKILAVDSLLLLSLTQ
ncbi:hypothetical protein F4703DRAFT_1872985 [Phycomyces blakesleeanus]